ncbi:MAG: Mov34/MPN/PAD-1 family protein [Chitinophagales bacterium]
MNIKIIREKKIKPQLIKFPTRNAEFSEITYPATNLVEAKHNELNVFMHYEVYDAIWKHAKKDLSIELGGALLGIYGCDSGKEFLLITGVINQPSSYYRSETMLRFTKQFYDDLDDYISQINEKYPNVIRLGLYHTHPNYGVFLSTTDAKTFKGIFKEKYQIAMVVDSVKDEDGVFYWQGNNISKRAAFRLYESDNPNFCFHQYTTNNRHIEASNTHLILDSKRPTIEATIQKNRDNAISIATNKNFQAFFSETNSEKRQKNKRLKLGFNNKKNEEIGEKQSILKIKSLPFSPKICPLYDMHYRNKQINLRRYNRSLSEKKQREFPYMTFIAKEVYDKIQAFWLKKQAIAGLLQGQFCFDKQKKLYFLCIENVILSENVWKENATQFIHDFYKKNQYKNRNDLLGWIYIHADLQQSMNKFVMLQKQLFDKSNHIGFVIKNECNKPFDLGKTHLVAYNFEKNESFDYFGNTFLYEEM